jgi:predicted phosphodiesterase
MRRWKLGIGAALLAATAALLANAQLQPFRFVILGDRTGEVQPGVYEEAWKEAAAENPAFVLSVGDSIEGLNDSSADAEWQYLQVILRPYRRVPLYLTAGNHDIWSEASEKLFRKYAGHAPHYGFDCGPVHVTVLDNSRSDALSAEELAFAEKDLQAHAASPVKFMVSHRPSWLIQAALGDPQFALHQLAKKYGARYVIAGHVHQLMHADLEGVTYLSMPSSGGHLRLSKQYEDGWFFGYAVVEVRGNEAAIQIRELAAPYGHGRVTRVEDWGRAGLKK